MTTLTDVLEGRTREIQLGNICTCCQCCQVHLIQLLGVIDLLAMKSGVKNERARAHTLII